MASEPKSTDPALWTVRRAFGVAGGPDEVILTEEGIKRSFSVGARVRRGPPADALAALANAGGEGLLSTREGSKLRRTELGRFDQVAWGHLRALGYVESFDREGVRLTEAGRLAVARGRDEQASLLDRCRRAAAESDREPEAPRITSAADDVAALCARLVRGPVTSKRFSVGRWTPAVDDGFSWAVLNQGAPLLLAHDCFEAALYFARLEDGTADVPSFEIKLPTDAQLADRRRWDQWYERYRFIGPKGDPNFTPECPYPEVA